MEPEGLNQLYDEAILQENKAPYHFAKRTDADLTLEAYNPLCGDQFRLFLFTDQGRIREAYFYGYGCAVSKASTSVLTRELEGLTLEEAKAKCLTFMAWLPGEETTGPKSWQSFTAVRRFPERLTCAQLAWKTVARTI